MARDVFRGKLGYQIKQRQSEKQVDGEGSAMCGYQVVSSENDVEGGRNKREQLYYLRYWVVVAGRDAASRAGFVPRRRHNVEM